MTCRGFQYEEGKEYTTDEAMLCKSGFHACEHPLDCLNYYAPSESVYHEVELGEVSDERETEDTKICAKKIKVGAALDIKGLIKAAFEYTKEQCDSFETGGYRSALTGGDRSALRGGKNTKFKGGMWTIFAAEVWENNEFKKVTCAVVDGEKINPDTWYTLRDEEFVEVE